jgi:hypothetical protein
MSDRDLPPRPPYLVLGLGNELFTDEGVGVAAALLATWLPGEREAVARA